MNFICLWSASIVNMWNYKYNNEYNKNENINHNAMEFGISFLET